MDRQELLEERVFNSLDAKKYKVDGKEGVWRTIRGRKVFIPDGTTDIKKLFREQHPDMAKKMDKYDKMKKPSMPKSHSKPPKKKDDDEEGTPPKPAWMIEREGLKKKYPHLFRGGEHRDLAHAYETIEQFSGGLLSKADAKKKLTELFNHAHNRDGSSKIEVDLLNEAIKNLGKPGLINDLNKKYKQMYVDRGIYDPFDKSKWDEPPPPPIEKGPSAFKAPKKDSGKSQDLTKIDKKADKWYREHGVKTKSTDKAFVNQAKDAIKEAVKRVGESGGEAVAVQYDPLHRRAYFTNHEWGEKPKPIPGLRGDFIADIPPRGSLDKKRYNEYIKSQIESAAQWIQARAEQEMREGPHFDRGHPMPKAPKKENVAKRKNKGVSQKEAEILSRLGF